MKDNKNIERKRAIANAIIIAVMVFVLACIGFGIFAIEAGAEETAPETEAVTEATTEAVTEPETEAQTGETTEPETTAPETDKGEAEGENKPEDEGFSSWWETVFSGETLAKLGGLLIAALTLILSSTATAKGLKAILVSVVNLLRGISTRKETEKVIADNSKEMLDALESKNGELKAEVEAMKKQYSETNAILAVALVHMNIPKSVKAEIMQILTGVKQTAGDTAKIVDEMEKAIAEAEATAEKIPTPALDEIEGAKKGE